jgi:hypothetical protein
LDNRKETLSPISSIWEALPEKNGDNNSKSNYTDISGLPASFLTGD